MYNKTLIAAKTAQAKNIGKYTKHVLANMVGPRSAKDPQGYRFYEFTYNLQTRNNFFCYRFAYWLDKNNMDINDFHKYINTFGRRYGMAFSKSLLYAYLYNKCCPKMDRLGLMARAMAVTPDWLAGYGCYELADDQHHVLTGDNDGTVSNVVSINNGRMVA